MRYHNPISPSQSWKLGLLSLVNRLLLRSSFLLDIDVFSRARYFICFRRTLSLKRTGNVRNVLFRQGIEYWSIPLGIGFIGIISGWDFILYLSKISFASLELLLLPSCSFVQSSFESFSIRRSFSELKLFSIVRRVFDFRSTIMFTSGPPFCTNNPFGEGGSTVLAISWYLECLFLWRLLTSSTPCEYPNLTAGSWHGAIFSEDGGGLRAAWNIGLKLYTVKPVFNGHSQNDWKLVFKNNYCFKQVKRIAECFCTCCYHQYKNKYSKTL